MLGPTPPAGGQCRLLAIFAALLTVCGDDCSTHESLSGLHITLEGPPGEFVACGEGVALAAFARTNNGAPVAGLSRSSLPGSHGYHSQ